MNLPGWADMSDLDKGAALLHDRARESEGDDYAAEHYPARYLRDPRLVALGPVEATAHARAVAQGLPRPLSVGVPANGNLTLHLSTPAEVDAWAALVGATVGHDDYAYRSDPDDLGSPIVHEYGTAWEHSTYGRWLGRKVALGCEVPGEPPRP
ncbi:hypothetical protein GCM10011608_11040 [Micromonospora sonchi]|uniref:Uncharacterized protein n=1 Tax=Micromonospora sonchi TaxID=1763543 RepID=A0A917TMV5_9ACTN|nr:hypothetical protein [Micromonospora sonchi]GGM27990.1 hypothetical protein GCM10011608_11040 [Micromonospora sonchi]